ncbi:tryptophan--tRNA ligase [Methanosarcinaceae archaeon]|nr:tryptophan--tRNA ligase [Methanosarcinaceae archaeon]MBQ3620616.1 tryptophan--tRNA ligase [Methanosarcinaceae archaeon]
MAQKLDPWKTSDIIDYSKLFEEFGISDFSDMPDRIPDAHRYMRRHLIFGHRNYEPIADAVAGHKPFAVLDGFMPSGHSHLGHKMVMDQIVWYQQHGAKVFVGIADREAYAVRGFSWEKCREIGIEEYLISLIALGLEPKDTYLYFQSKCAPVKDLAFELGTKVTFSELSAIYGFSGETHLSHMMSTATQAADILLPQLKQFGGPCPVIVPVGADQDPHIRLTRGLAAKMNMFLIEERTDPKDGKSYLSIRSKDAPEGALKEIVSGLKKEIKENGLPAAVKESKEHADVIGDPEKLRETVRSIVEKTELAHGGYAFIAPSSSYHRFMTGLQGGKMSSSKPESHIALTEDPKSAAKKVSRSKTGGRASLEEQKELGGEPDKCSVFELLMFHLSDDDDELLQIRKECLCGERVCGTCKKLAAERMEAFLTDHQKKREEARKRLSEFTIIQ